MTHRPGRALLANDAARYAPPPDLFGAYGCSDDTSRIAWGDDDGSIDKSGPTWTVQVGTPTGPLRTEPIAVAYFAATA